MFIKKYQPLLIKNTKTVELTCSHCGNKTKHQIHEVYYGPQVGIIFLKKPLLSLKKYYLVCPICSNATKELTKEQVKAHKIQDSQIK